MQKKLEAELVSIAHSILQMKNRNDIKALKQKAYETYEKLAVLAYIEGFVNETPENTKTVDELVAQTFSNTINEEKEIEDIATDEPVKEELVKENNVSDETEKNLEVEKQIVEQLVEEDDLITNDVEQPITVEDEPQFVAKEQVTEIVEEKEIEEPKETLVDEESTLDLFTKVEQKDVKEPTELQSSLKKEFGETVSIDVATNMFEKATRVSAKKSLNDVVMQQKNLQIDLNDRISFVKHLFDNSQEDFNRVVSQLNTMTSEKEALSFLKMVKKEYHWGGKEIYEDRLILLIERKFN